MPPVMSDAYEDSVELDDAIEKQLKDKDALPKDKPFLGASKQPVPKEPEEAKINLDESLFDDDSPLTDPYDDNYSLEEQIFDFLDHSDSFDPVEMAELVSDEFGISIDEAEGYVQDWSIRYNSNDLDTEELEEELDDEDDQSESEKWWNSLGTEESEDMDLWTLVYEALSRTRDLAADNAVKRYDTLSLPYQQRYEDVNVDADGNIVVFAASSEDLEPAKKVARYHNLDTRESSSGSYGKLHPDQAFNLTIIIPESRYDDFTNRKGKKRNKRKK